MTCISFLGLLLIVMKSKDNLFNLYTKLNTKVTFMSNSVNKNRFKLKSSARTQKASMIIEGLIQLKNR